MKQNQHRFLQKAFINNQFVQTTGQIYEIINPNDQSVLSKAPRGSIEDMEKAIKAARQAFDQGPWPRMQPNERAKLMFKLAELVEANSKELAELESINVGKPLMFANIVDMPMVSEVFRYYGGWVDKIEGKVINTTSSGPGKQIFAYTLKQPVGVVGQIIPWNFPLVMASWKLGPALASGCCVVLKPAEQTPFTVLRLGQLIKEAGFPPGVVNIVPGFGDIGAHLVRHENIDKVAFTGSCQVGCDIMKNCHPKNLKRVTLELGGKSPNIITKNANLKKALEQAFFSVYFNSGQCCNAGTRTFVHSSIYDDYVNGLVELSKGLKVGHCYEEGVMMGPIITKEQFDRVMKYIEIGKKQGATLKLGGNRMYEKGYFIEPTIFTDVTDDMTIAKEEIFGPVMCILKYDELDEVVRRANKTSFGLAGGIVSEDFSQVQYLSRKLKAGQVYVNCYGAIQKTTPFGGFKDSGFGRELGQEGLNLYLETKTVIHQY